MTRTMFGNNASWWQYLFSTVCIALVLQTISPATVMAWKDSSVQPKGFVLASNYFGLNLYRQLCIANEKLPQKQNLFLSPYSVASALAMVHLGSEANTARQIESTLGLELAELNQHKLSAGNSFQNYTQQIFNVEPASNGTPDNILKTANALVISDSFDVKNDYKQSIKDLFNGELFQTDFKTKPVESMELINQWCSSKTNGKIDKLLKSPPSENTQMALINAVYFKGAWKLKFNPEQTETGTFYSLDGKQYNDVQFMTAKDYYYTVFLNELDANLVEMKYEGDSLSLFAILPKNVKGDLANIKKALNPWYVESLISRLYEQEFTLKFPKLDLKTEYNMKKTLQGLGMLDLFNGASNLTGISEQNLAVDQVKHVATLVVNEEGSEAAAATYVGMVKMSLAEPIVHKFDHPFLFFIRHKQTGQILFIGEVNNFE